MPDDLVAESRGGVDQVFAVVQQDEAVLFGQRLDDGLGDRDAPEVLDAECGRDDVGDLAAIGQRRQLGEPDPVGGLADELGASLQCQSGLAAAARAS